MKRLFTILGAVLAIAACSRQDAPKDGNKLIEWTFTAPDTKAGLAEDGKFSWSAGDEIAVWNSTASQFVKFSTATGSGIFRATAPQNASFTGTAYFPFDQAKGSGSFTLPSSYDAGDSDVDMGLLAMYADVVPGNDILHFKHQCAYLTVQIQNAPQTLTSLVISGAGVSLCGDFSLTEASGAKEIRAVSGSDAVTVSFDLSGEKSMLKFTIPVPTGTYAVSFTAKAGNDEIMTRSSEELTFTRANLYKLHPSEPGSENMISLTGCEAYTLQEDTTNWQ